MSKKLNAFDLLKGTSIFIWKKMFIGFLSMLILFLPIGIFFSIGCVFSMPAGILLGIIGLLIGSALQKLFYRYVGYMIKAAHIAVITKSVKKGEIPNNQYEYGKKMVKDSFTETNVYFVIDSLVSKAVKQIQSKMSGLGEIIGNIIPFAESFINQFIRTSLDYIDECCLGYTFYREEENNKFKTSCDGIVLYFQNWKDLIKTSLKASAISLGLSLIVFAVPALMFGFIFNFFLDGSTALIIGVVFGAIISGTIKSAIIDTYVYIEVMNSFMPYAISQEPQLDLYDKFCKFSKSFKELFTKAKSPVTNNV